MSIRLRTPLLLLLLAAAWFNTGCAGPRPVENRPLSAREMEQFFSRAQDERRFWLTKYESDQGPVFSGAHRLHADKFALMPFEGHRNLPVPKIAVRLRSPQEHAALIDSSARANWIEFGLAQTAGVIPIGPPSYQLFAAHVNDAIPGYLSVASRLILDQLHVDTALLYVKAAHGPMTELTRDEKALRAPIILGSEFLRAFHFVQINYPARTVLFSTTTPYEADPDRLLTSVPMRELNGIIAVEGYFDDQRTPFLLDTLGDYSVASNFESHQTVQQIIIGDLVLRNQPHAEASTLDLGMLEVPRIGRRILSRYIVTFDRRNRLIHFERP